MKLLLDTHVFIWWDTKPKKLPKKVIALCQDSDNTLFVSLASLWEMQIKLQLGKLSLNLSLAEMVSSQQANGIELLPITFPHILKVGELPSHHNDPFDRLLVAQAIAEDIVVITADKTFTNYPIKTVW
jgi:PIN domain nuclease of toxin-antitoxin system